jgi:hypothetical protein
LQIIQEFVDLFQTQIQNPGHAIWEAPEYSTSVAASDLNTSDSFESQLFLASEHIQNSKNHFDAVLFHQDKRALKREIQIEKESRT